MKSMLCLWANEKLAQGFVLLWTGWLISTGANAELCRCPADQSRAEALYTQAQQQPGTAEALKALETSIELCPGIYQSRYALAENLLQMGRTVEAEQAANNVISVADPGDWEKQLAGWVLVAEAQRGQGRWGEAKATYDLNVQALLNSRKQKNVPSRVAPPWFVQAIVAFEDALAARGGLKAGEIAGLFRSAKSTGAMPRIALRVEFDYDSAVLTQQGRAQLQEVAKAMGDEASRSFSFQVIGHTDTRGTSDYNQKLSERRAQAAVAELTRLQPELVQRMRPEGRGLREPLIPDATDDAQHAINRRVEFEAK